MPTYEFRCRACGTTFGIQRPMSQSEEPASCPSGHDDTVRLLTTLGLGGATSQPAAPVAGGCCGGGCGCG